MIIDEKSALDEVVDELRELQEYPEFVSTDPQEAYELWIQQLDSDRKLDAESYQYRIEPFLRLPNDWGR